MADLPEAPPPSPPRSCHHPRPDLPDLPCTLRHTLLGHTRAVAAVRFSPCGSFLASASADGTARVWDASTGKSLRTLSGHSAGLSDVCWSPDGALLATASDDLTLRVWDAATGRLVHELSSHTHWVACCAWSASGTMLASGAYDESAVVWDAASGRALRATPAHSDPVVSLAFDGARAAPCLATGSFDGLIRLWSAATGRCMATLMDCDCSPVSCVRFAPNGGFLLGARLDSQIALWDCRAKKPVRRFRGHANDSYCVQACFATAPWLLGGAEEPSLEQQAAAQCVLAGSEDHHAYLWAVNGGEGEWGRLLGVLRGREGADSPGDGHCDVVLCVDADPVHWGRLATGGHERDCTIKIWDVDRDRCPAEE